MLETHVDGIPHESVVVPACCEAEAAKVGLWLPVGFPLLPYRSRDVRVGGSSEDTGEGPLMHRCPLKATLDVSGSYKPSNRTFMRAYWVSFTVLIPLRTSSH